MWRIILITMFLINVLLQPLNRPNSALAQELCKPDNVVIGLIGARWNGLGGRNGPLGCPISDELPLPDGNGRYQQFEHGQIATSPNYDTNFAIAVYQDYSNLVVDWGDTLPHYHYDYFNVWWSINGIHNNSMQQTLHAGEAGISQSSGHWIFPNPSPGGWGFQIEGCDNGSFPNPSSCNPGWSTQLHWDYKTPPPPNPNGSCVPDQPVNSLISARWHALGAAAGPLGCPTAPDLPVTGADGRFQQFQHGQIVTSPNYDSNFALAIYQEVNNLVVDWGDTAPHYHYDYFNVWWSFNGYHDDSMQRTLHAGEDHISQSTGRWLMPNPQLGTYVIQVEGCDNGSFPFHSPCNESWSRTASISYAPVAVPSPHTICDLDDGVVGGLIGDEWRSLGGRAGPLGCPTSVELPTDQRFGRYQWFEHGQIVWSESQQMVIAAYPQHDGVTLIWKIITRYNYDEFIIDWSKNDTHVSSATLYAGVATATNRTGGRWSVPGGNGIYQITIAGCITNPIGPPQFCTEGASSPITVAYKSEYTVDLSSITPATTTTSATLDFDRRAQAAIDYGACHGMQLGVLYKNEDDFSGVAIAKLATGIARCLDEDKDNVTQVNEALQRSIQGSAVGTSIDTAVCYRTGEYDFALKGLITMMYLYPEKLQQKGSDGQTTYNYVLHHLLNYHGGHDPEIEQVSACVVNIPESENHILMTETSRFLTNQLLAKEAHNQGKDVPAEYDNSRNGFNDWMLQQLQQILMHDFAEYNARPYQHFTLAAIQNLYEFTCDPRVISGSFCDQRVKTAARMVLDYDAAKFAVGSNGLRRVAPFRRLKESLAYTNLFGFRLDPLMARFLMYSGLTQQLNQELNHVDPSLHAHWYAADDMVLAAVGTYRVPDMILDLAMNKEHNSYYQRFYHGIRSRLNIHGGVELYASAAPFLITAGGIFMESDMGPDSFTDDKDTGQALPTTLMPTVSGIDRNDFIRINGVSDDRERRNTCIARDGTSDFACGLNVEIPNAYLPQDPTNPDACHVIDGAWIILDFSGACSSLSNFGYYVAVYKTKEASIPPQTSNFGFFEVVSSMNRDFKTFQENARYRNTQRFLRAGHNNFVTATGHTIQFIPDPAGNKYQWGVIAMDGIPYDTDIGHWPLAEGDIINSDGHSGFTTIDNPALHQRLILDMRNWWDPRRIEVPLSSAGGTITPESGGHVATSESNFRIDFPAQAVSNSTVVTYTDQHIPTRPLFLGSMALRSFTLKARTSDGQPVTQFQQPYTMVISYTAAELAALGISESSLKLAFWDTQSNRWVSVPASIDAINHRVTASLDHFTEFALFGSKHLDDFNRPNGPLGSSWSGHTEGDDYQIRDQQLHLHVGDRGTLYWQPDTFGSMQEAFVTLVHIDTRTKGEDARQSVLLKVQGETPDTNNGAIEVRYYAQARKVRVQARGPAQDWQVLAEFSTSFADGDQLGARALADGHVQAFRNGILIGEADAGDFFANRGGRIGLRCIDARDTVLDDFGGGNSSEENSSAISGGSNARFAVYLPLVQR